MWSLLCPATKFNKQEETLMKGLKTRYCPMLLAKNTFCGDFYLVFRLLDIVLLLVILGQWFYQITTGEKHLVLADFGASLGSMQNKLPNFYREPVTRSLIHFKTGPKPRN